MIRSLPHRAMVAALLAIALAAPAAADTYPRQPGIDAWHYVFRLTLSDTSPEIQGDATVDLLVTKDGVADAFLDLASAAGGKGMTVTSVTIDGRSVSFVHRDNRLALPLPQPARAGRHVRFTIAYHGAPANGLRLIPNKYGEWCAFSENWPNRAREWLPMIDHPYDKATSEFIVTAPSKYQVVANGLLQETRDLGDGRRRTHWKQSVPIASWLNAVGVEQFDVHHVGMVKDVELQTWVAHQDALAGRTYFELPAYYRQYRNASASTADFRRVMEQASGQDLGWFFDEWLTRPKSPSFDGSWHYDPATKRIAITLDQTQAGEAYRMPAEFGVTVDARPVPTLRIERVQMTAKHSTFTIASDVEPSAVTFDPGTWLLVDQVKFEKR